MEDELQNLTNMEKLIIEYIAKYPNCEYKTIKKDLVESKEKKMSLNSLKYHLYKSETSLLKKGFILNRSERIHGKETFPNEFYVHPDYKHAFTPHHEVNMEDFLDRTLKLVNYHHVVDGYYPNTNEGLPIIFLKGMIMKNTQIKITSKGSKFLLIDKFEELFYELIYSMLIECFFNNPHNWFQLKNKDDFNFTIEISANWNKEEKIFELLQTHKQKCTINKLLFSILDSQFQAFIDEKTRKEILKGLNYEILFHIANSKTSLRKSEQEKRNLEKNSAKQHCLNIIAKEKDRLKHREKAINYLEELENAVKKEYIYLTKEYTGIEWEDGGYPYFDED